jgi:nucleotide-binding universal stress UspA family protein
MMQRILVPLDGSSPSEGVLGPVLALAKAWKADLTLFHAVSPSEYFSATAARYAREERERSEDYLRRLAERLGREGISARQEVVTGDAPREIAAEAQRVRADLIALRSHVRSGSRDWPFGSVAERLLRSTRTPVLLFREGQFWGPMIRKILVVVDGSEESLEALSPVLDVATGMGSAVSLVAAGSRLPPTIPVARKMLLAHHVPFASQLLPGEPIEAILAAVHREHADLVALTTPGDAGSFAKTAEGILKRCDRPLLVVPTGRVS